MPIRSRSPRDRGHQSHQTDPLAHARVLGDVLAQGIACCVLRVKIGDELAILCVDNCVRHRSADLVLERAEGVLDLVAAGAVAALERVEALADPTSGTPIDWGSHPVRSATSSPLAAKRRRYTRGWPPDSRC
jgi:hypothetical protein